MSRKTAQEAMIEALAILNSPKNLTEAIREIRGIDFENTKTNAPYIAEKNPNYRTILDIEADGETKKETN